MQEIQVVGSNKLEMMPGGYYNLNEKFRIEERVVRLHMLIAHAERCIEDICDSNENHVLDGKEIEDFADSLYETYRPAIESGHDVFQFEGWFRPGKVLEYETMFTIFKATGKDVASLSEYVEYSEGPGRIYLDGLLHLASTIEWEDELNQGKKWYLQIFNEQYLSDDLEWLEYQLFIFAVGFGHFHDYTASKEEV